MLAHASRDQQLANSTLLVPHPSSLQQATRSKDVKCFLTTVRPDTVEARCSVAMLAAVTQRSFTCLG